MSQAFIFQSQRDKSSIQATSSDAMNSSLYETVDTPLKEVTVDTSVVCQLV